MTNPKTTTVIEYPEIDYKKNLKEVLGEYEYEVKILKNCFGILKGRLKKSPASYQRILRKEWER